MWPRSFRHPYSGLNYIFIIVFYQYRTIQQLVDVNIRTHYFIYLYNLVYIYTIIDIYRWSNKKYEQVQLGQGLIDDVCGNKNKFQVVVVVVVLVIVAVVCTQAPSFLHSFLVIQFLIPTVSEKGNKIYFMFNKYIIQIQHNYIFY